MDKLAIVRTIVKVVAIGVGFVGTLVCLMAAVGIVTQNGWVRLGVAAVVAIALPAFLADRMLPTDTKDPKAKGLPGDVFALLWLGVPLVFAVALNGVTRPWLTTEGDRLRSADQALMARLAYLLAGVDAQAADIAPDPAASASASAAASATAVPSASPVTTSSATATASASAATAPPPKPGGDPDKPTPAELFKQWAPSVVTIKVETPGGSGGGTGFLLDDKGTIATNHHVIDSAQKGAVKFMNGAVYEEVWVLVEDPDADLALLRVDVSSPKEGDPPKADPTVLGDSDKIQVGEAAISIGNPLGLEHTLTTGIVSSRRTYRGKQWIQMSTPISPGNSGGPVFNSDGEVMGVSTAVVGGFMAQNLNLAVPINVLKAKIKGDYPGKHKLGATGGASSW